MTITPTPRHIATLEEAEELGELAGRHFYRIAQQTCHPSLWTEERRAQWIGLLRTYRANPYLDDPHHEPEHAVAYAQRWQLAFERGSHAEESETRRGSAWPSTPTGRTPTRSSETATCSEH